MGIIYNRHLERRQAIRKAYPNHKIEEQWECMFDHEMKINPHLQQFLFSRSISEPINPRDSLFGGRTNAFKLFHKVQPGEKIKYYDYTSLYPDIQKNGIFPIGHPKIFTENFQDINNYFGVVKCLVLPPRKLLMPVLPARLNGKLVFTLCNTCALNQSRECSHSDKERSLLGTWITLEIQEAVRQGYKIEKIFEVWHYEKTDQYNPETMSGGLFTDYVNKFLSFKVEASGFPHHIVDKEQYIKDYEKNEGIKLGNISKNSGLRSVAKIMLNSFWGRYALDNRKVQYKIFRDPADWFQMLTDNKFEIHNVDLVNENVLQVFYSIKEQHHEMGNDVNVVIASFVTCQARLKLYSELKKLGERVLYCDTDSIIFIQREGEYTPQLGDYLGQFTNEIDPSEGEITKAFASGSLNKIISLRSRTT